MEEKDELGNCKRGAHNFFLKRKAIKLLMHCQLSLCLFRSRLGPKKSKSLTLSLLFVAVINAFDVSNVTVIQTFFADL